MCGRVRVTTQAAAIAQAYDAKADADATLFRPGDYTPSARLLAISGGEDGRQAGTSIWGKRAEWLRNGDLLRHARAESALAKPTFEESARTRRCIVPVDAWFERGTRPGVPKGPHKIWAKGGSMTGLAALYWPPTMRGGFRRLVVVTKQAMGEAAAIHHRTPMVVRTDDIETWLDAEAEIDAVRRLLARPAAEEGRFQTKISF